MAKVEPAFAAYMAKKKPKGNAAVKGFTAKLKRKSRG